MDRGDQNGSRRDIVVIGGSSGALQALEFIGDLPSDFRAALFVVMHVAPGGPGLLPAIIRKYSKIPVNHARDGEAIAAGRIYVAPPDYHLSLGEGFVQVARGPKENRHRPSIDVLFRSAARCYGPRVIGMVLSGNLDDGSAGLVEIRTAGGIAIVQDPKDALFPEMPYNALAQAGADHSAPRSQLAMVLTKAVMEITGKKPFEPVQRRRKAGEASEASMNGNNDYGRSATPSNFSCPDCGGVLRRIDDKKTLRFRCRVGHALSSSTLHAAQSDNVEQALWTALRALEEKAELARKMRDYSVERNLKAAPEKFESEAKKLHADAGVIRQLLKNTESSEVV